MPIEKEKARWEQLKAESEKRELDVAQIVGDYDLLGIARAAAYLSPIGTMTKVYREGEYTESHVLSARLLQDYFLPPEKQEIANAVECLLLSKEEGLENLESSLYKRYEKVPHVSLNENFMYLLKEGTERLTPEVWRNWAEEEKGRYFARLIRFAYSACQVLDRKEQLIKKKDEKEEEDASSPFTPLLTAYQRAVGRNDEWYQAGSRQAIREETVFEIGYSSMKRSILAYSFALTRAMKQRKECIIWIYPDRKMKHVAYEEACQLFGEEAVGSFGSNRLIQFGTIDELKRAVFHCRKEDLIPYVSFARSVIIIDQYERVDHEWLLPLMQEMEYIRAYFDATIVWMRSLPYSAWLSTKVRHLSFEAYPTLLLKGSNEEAAPVHRMYWTRERIQQVVQEETRPTLFLTPSQKKAEQMIDECVRAKKDVYFVNAADSFEEKERTYKKIAQSLIEGQLFYVIATENVPFSFPVIYIERMSVEQMYAVWGQAQERYILWEEAGKTYDVEPLSFFSERSQKAWQKWWNDRLTSKYLTRYAYEDLRFATRAQQLQ